MSGAWQAVAISTAVLAVIELYLTLVLFRQFGLVYLGRSDARSRDGLPLRTVSPQWEAMDQWGQRRTSEEFLGRPQLLVFTDAGCAPCSKLMPELRAFSAEVNGDISVVIFGRSDKAINAAVAEQYELEMPVLTQSNDDVSRAFRVVATPFVFFVDAQGQIREKGVVNHREQLEKKSKSIPQGLAGAQGVVAQHGRSCLRPRRSDADTGVLYADHLPNFLGDAHSSGGKRRYAGARRWTLLWTATFTRQLEERSGVPEHRFRKRRPDLRRSPATSMASCGCITSSR